MGYSKQALIGVSWVGFLKVVMRVFTLIRISILARIFTPAEFGLYGIASLILSLIEIIAETGVNIFLIQEKKSAEKYINTAWIASIVRGIIIAFIIVISSPFVVLFFNIPNAIHLLILISIVPLIRGFINPSVAFYQKELQFKNEFLFRSTVFLIESATVILVALSTHAISSIIVGLIIGAIAEVILSFFIVKPRPFFRFEKNLLWNILHKGKWVTAAGVFNYLFHNVDDILVGKILGATSLGFYQMAYKISIFPITEIADVLSRVSFPLFVKISQDQKRLRRAFYKTLGLVSLLCMILGITLFVFTEPIVRIILGSKWLPIISFLKILIVFGVIRGISGFSSSLFLAVKKQEYVSAVTLISFISVIILIIPLIKWGGLVGASMAPLIASIIALPIMGYFVYKILYV